MRGEKRLERSETAVISLRSVLAPFINDFRHLSRSRWLDILASILVTGELLENGIVLRCFRMYLKLSFPKGSGGLGRISVSRI